MKGIRGKFLELVLIAGMFLVFAAILVLVKGESKNLTEVWSTWGGIGDNFFSIECFRRFLVTFFYLLFLSHVIVLISYCFARLDYKREYDIQQGVYSLPPWRWFSPLGASILRAGEWILKGFILFVGLLPVFLTALLFQGAAIEVSSTAWGYAMLGMIGLGLSGMVIIDHYQFFRLSFQEIGRRTYIETARVKGIDPLNYHIPEMHLRRIDSVRPVFLNLLGASFFFESYFSTIPGMGWLKAYGMGSYLVVTVTSYPALRALEELCAAAIWILTGCVVIELIGFCSRRRFDPEVTHDM